eukprot:CAMPEP_0179360116 /NCGR_PEP_ID=MMETSP0797-20121207/79804_1 /TAXON_ID=47934 /ORGANISM="Dinophysis acuminata, Strain DAEP01" /LENGTH=292 /DNA_ID=CAMNT_0021075447 /DNA_START=195 /DNA_END=1071 /DNA_ORIENTATION=+
MAVDAVADACRAEYAREARDAGPGQAPHFVPAPLLAQSRALVDQVGEAGRTVVIFFAGIAVGVVATLTLSAYTRHSECSGSAPGRAAPQDTQACPAPGEREGRSATESLESMDRFLPRYSCLVVLLLLQSVSSLILDRFHRLFDVQPEIMLFLTMVVGTGGNVGGQSVVHGVRSLAMGHQVKLHDEVYMGIKLSLALAPVVFLRCIAQVHIVRVCSCLATAVLAIVLTAASLGAITPRVLAWARVDPAHATPIIQVIMDILGVLITCLLGVVFLSVDLRAEDAAALRIHQTR